MYSFIWFSLFITTFSYGGLGVYYGRASVWLFCATWLVVVFIRVFLAESQRSPFDFAEGESELVSGFNTEYSSLYFALVFLGENGVFLFACGVASVYLFGSAGSLVVWFALVLISVLLILLRSISPRFRYDLMLSLVWLILLPLGMYVFCLVFVV